MAGTKAKSSQLRHRKVLRDNILGITKPAIRRLCFQAGIKSVSGLVYDEIRAILKMYVENLIQDINVFADAQGRKVVSVEDVINALETRGIKLSFSKNIKNTNKSLRCA